MAATSPQVSSLNALLELTKPRLTSLVLVTTAAGYWMGLSAEASLWGMVPTVLGTAFVAGGASALNQWYERHLDAQMHRTQSRPLPAGLVQPQTALVFGLVCTVVGLIILSVWVNALATFLAFVSSVSYLLMYTPLKRVTVLCTLVGAVPGALPPMIGWVGAANAVRIDAWALFFILFIWQLPHFLALAVMFKDDYARAQFHMLPLMETDNRMTGRQSALYAACLIPISLFPTVIHMTGVVYFWVALVLGIVFFASTVFMAIYRTHEACRRVFLISITYLPILLLVMALDKR